MNFIDTLKDSLLEGFFPSGWDMARIDACCANPPQSITQRQSHWNPSFTPIPCESLSDFNIMMGHEIAWQIKKSREEKIPLVMIFPVGPMGMYRWAVFFLKEWGVSCDHVHGFNMDEWSDNEGNTLDPTDPGAFEYAMKQAFYGPLGGSNHPGESTQFCYAVKSTVLPRKNSRLESQRCAPDYHFWHWTHVPYCFLGTALRSRIYLC